MQLCCFITNFLLSTKLSLLAVSRPCVRTNPTSTPANPSNYLHIIRRTLKQEGNSDILPSFIIFHILFNFLKRKFTKYILPTIFLTKIPQILRTTPKDPVGPVAQSIQRLVTCCTVRGSKPGGSEILRTCPDRPWGPPSILYNGYRVFPGGKERPGRDADPTPPSSAVVMKEQSYTSTPRMGRTACTEPQCLYKGAVYLFFTKGSNKTQTPGTFCAVMNPLFFCRKCLSNSTTENGTKEFRSIIDVRNLKLQRCQIVCLLYNTCRGSASPVVHTRYRGTRIESRNSEQCYACLGVYICQ